MALGLQVTDDLKNFLTTNLPKVKKEGKAKFKLGVSEPKLGSAIQVRQQHSVAAQQAQHSRRSTASNGRRAAAGTGAGRGLGQGRRLVGPAACVQGWRRHRARCSASS